MALWRAGLHLFAHHHAIDEVVLCLYKVAHHIADRADFLVLHRLPVEFCLTDARECTDGLFELPFDLCIFFQRVHEMSPPCYRVAEATPSPLTASASGHL